MYQPDSAERRREKQEIVEQDKFITYLRTLSRNNGNDDDNKNNENDIIEDMNDKFLQAYKDYLTSAKKEQSWENFIEFRKTIPGSIKESQPIDIKYIKEIITVMNEITNKMAVYNILMEPDTSIANWNADIDDNITQQIGLSFRKYLQRIGLESNNQSFREFEEHAKKYLDEYIDIHPNEKEWIKNTKQILTEMGDTYEA